MTTTTPTIKPTGNYILIENVPRSDSSVILPSTLSPTLFGNIIVRAVGPKVEGIAVGDHVLLRPNCNTLGTAENENIVLTDAGSVVAILS